MLICFQKVNSFKFGVLYAKERQDETAMYNNRAYWHAIVVMMLLSLVFIPVEEGSEGFVSFLELLGEKIQLEGWTKYAAGLDTNRTAIMSNKLYPTYGNAYL